MIEAYISFLVGVAVGGGLVAYILQDKKATRDALQTYDSESEWGGI